MAQPDAYEGPTLPEVAGYRVEELVGVGGTGEVWRARDVLNGRLVALKRLRHDGPPVERDRLRREAAVLAGLSSPHVVRLVTVVTSAHGLILVLDYQAGGSLASLLRTRPVLAPGEVVTIAAPLAAALAEVHQLGLVHGDISPANILFAGDGRPVLSDLGVTRLLGRTAVPSVTAAFADPAVLEGAPFTPASDVYALAAVCYTALTGGSPAASGERRLVAELAPSAPQGLASVVDAALSEDAGRRPDAATFAARLLEAAQPQPVRLAGASVPVESPPTTAVRRWPAPVVALEPVPGRVERLAAFLGRRRVTPRGLVALGAVPVAVGGAIWGGVAWARSTSAAAPAWSAPVVSVSPVATHPASPGSVTGPARAATPAVVAKTPQASTAQGPPPAAAKTGASAGHPAMTPTAPTTPAGWLAVLRALDRTRDLAFVRAQPSLLTQVYAAGSSLLAQDRERLASMRAAGEHARGLALSARRASVVSAGATRAELLVTDTLAPYSLVSSSGTTVSAAGRGAATWRIALVGTGSGWRIQSISPAPSAGSGAQP